MAFREQHATFRLPSAPDAALPIRFRGAAARSATYGRLGVSAACHRELTRFSRFARLAVAKCGAGREDNAPGRGVNATLTVPPCSYGGVSIQDVAPKVAEPRPKGGEWRSAVTVPRNSGPTPLTTTPGKTE
jgi:hypothetical protein